MKKDSILVVIDVQNDFITGSLGTQEAQQALPRIVDKIKSYKRKKYQKIFATQDWHLKEDYVKSQEGRLLPTLHCVAETDGARFPDCISPFSFYNIYTKRTFGYPWWNNPYFVDAALNAESIELVGFCTDICVLSNALILKAMFPELPISVDAQCCAGTTPEKHAMALEILRSNQVKVTNWWNWNKPKEIIFDTDPLFMVSYDTPPVDKISIRCPECGRKYLPWQIMENYKEGRAYDYYIDYALQNYICPNCGRYIEGGECKVIEADEDKVMEGVFTKKVVEEWSQDG